MSAAKLRNKLELTPEDLAKRIPSGRQGAFENRVHWAKFYLGKAGLIESTGWGRFKTTARGQQVLDAHPAQLDNDFLNQFDDFRQFIEKSADATTPDHPLPIEPAGAGQTETPDEIMRVFLHPGGGKEWAICLNKNDNPSKLLGWRPT